MELKVLFSEACVCNCQLPKSHGTLKVMKGLENTNGHGTPQKYGRFRKQNMFFLFIWGILGLISGLQLLVLRDVGSHLEEVFVDR